MYALPNQTLAHAMEDARQAIALNPDHLSFYHLTLEPNTAFHRTPPSLPDDDLSADMQEQIEAILAEHGYVHYETSAFSKATAPNKSAYAKHNLNYWQFGDYLGIGAGAHSKLSYHDKITRETRHKHPKAFMENAEAGHAVDNEWLIAQADLGFEFMMNALRLTGGFETRLFQERTGQSINSIHTGLQVAAEKKLITQDLQRIAPTILGQRYLNDLLELFLN